MLIWRDLLYRQTVYRVCTCCLFLLVKFFLQDILFEMSYLACTGVTSLQFLLSDLPSINTRRFFQSSVRYFPQYTQHHTTSLVSSTVEAILCFEVTSGLVALTTSIIIIEFLTSHFPGKYCPILGCSNQQDYAGWSYL